MRCGEPVAGPVIAAKDEARAGAAGPGALTTALTPLGDLAILEEDKRYLEMRVARLDSGMAWAEDPSSPDRQPRGAPLENGKVRAKTAFPVYRSHRETDHQLLSGCREDVLRKVNGGWKVARRTIALDANVLLDKNLSVFL